MSVILATAGQDDKIRFWEAPSGVCSRILRYADSQVNCLEITPDKQYLAAGGNPHIRLFEINNSSNQSILALEGHTGNVTCLGFQRNGRYLYSSSEDGTVKLWDLRSPTYSRSFDSKGPVNSVALHPNQSHIISGDQNGSIKLWDLGSSKCIIDIIPECSSNSVSTSSLGRVAIQSVDVSNDTLIAANNHAEVFCYDAMKATLQTPSPTSPTPMDTNDHTGITTTSQQQQTLQPKAKFRAHSYGSYLLHAKISPDGRSLVTTSSDHTARLFDTSTWTIQQTLAQHSKWVWDAVFSADSSYLVTASSDRTARLWNLRSGAPVRQYTDHNYAVTCVALNDSST